jgi:hypothetical protein
LLVARLGIRPGDTVIDVCAGPGLNLGALRAAVGPHGTVIAVEQSCELLGVAAAQVTRRGWDNVELINAPARTVRLSLHADAALFAAAPQVLACPAAVANILAQLRADPNVAAGGWRYPTTWHWPRRRLVTTLHSAYLTDTTGHAQPWRLLAEHVRSLQVSQVGRGAGYLAHTTPALTPSHHRQLGEQPRRTDQHRTDQHRG